MHDSCDLGNNRITVCERQHGEQFVNDSLAVIDSKEDAFTTCLQCLVAPDRFRSMH